MKNRILFKALYWINVLYSMIWIRVTGKDKFDYREESKIHHILSDTMYRNTVK